MDHVENQCNEANAYGCKVTHKLIRPDMYICGDEVGGNLSMKGDGNEAWKLLLGERRYIAQEKASAQNRKFTSICFTALTGDPVMCVLIYLKERHPMDPLWGWHQHYCQAKWISIRSKLCWDRSRTWEVFPWNSYVWI